jgi:hypothetical protein
MSVSCQGLLDNSLFWPVSVIWWIFGAMKVKELKALLADAPEDLEVMVQVENHLKPGMFAFASACKCDTGITELGPGEDGKGGETVFLVLPHGAGLTEEEIESGETIIPELN